MSTDIRLPSQIAPIFPQRCVYSGEPSPDSDVGVVAHTQNLVLHFLAPFLWLVGWRKVRAPIRSPYRAKFYFQAYARTFITLAVIVVALVFVMPMFEPGTPWRKVKVLGLCIAALLPWVLFETLFPPRFDVTVHEDHIDYQFASAEYGEEFARLNAGHVIQVSRPPM